MEENILFKATTLYDLPTYREFTRGYNNAMVRPNICRVIFILYSLLYCLKFGDTLYLYTYIGTIALCAVLFIILRFVNRKGNLGYRRYITAHFGKPVEQTFEFSDTGVHFGAKGNDQDGGFLYDQVKHVVETPNLLVLIIACRQAILIRKDNLEGGTTEDLLNHLRQVCTGWRSRKVRREIPGKILQKILLAVVAICLALAVCRFPGVEVFHRMNGSVINTMGYDEIAEKLEPLGITGSDEEMYRELEEVYGYYYRGTGYGDFLKSTDLLCWLGMGQWDDVDGPWTPSSNGVFAPSIESYSPETMYSNFLRGVTAMVPGALEITDISQDNSRIDPEDWCGTIVLSFTLDGQRHTLELDATGNWLDMDALARIGDIISASDSDKSLYFADDESAGLLVFFRDAAWASEFTRITRIPLYTDPNDIWY